MIPYVFGEITAGEPMHVDAILERILAFASDRLALARGKRDEEILEAAVAGILPVELLIGALQESEFAQEAVFGLGRERDMHPRSAIDAAELDKPAGQCSAGVACPRAGPHQEPAAGRRREGDSDLQFRIVVAASMGVRLGPALVEDIFAARMAFEIAGRCGHERTVGGLHQQMLNVPTGPCADRFRTLQR
jgi:hypothetical protein